MDQEIERYLNDHLAGATGAVRLIQELADKAENTVDREFFERLQEEVESDRVLLQDLLAVIGAEPSAALKLAGNVSVRISFMKLAWEGFKPGQLGMYEALEVLALGIQGKCLLWRMLHELIHWFPEWDDADFEKLELDATRQRDQVESYRIREGLKALVDHQRIGPPASLP
ncbi:MAG: hypothetical protein ABI162_08330 [Luteolibacter sp.]